MINEIDFEKILNEIEANPSPIPTVEHCLIVENLHWGRASSKYRVFVPKGYEDGFDETELITRCDNKTHDLRKDAGKNCHFGGHVKWIDETTAEVTVWTD